MAGRVIVKGSFTNVSASARFIAALTASIASSPLADDEGRYYAVAGGEILSQPVQGTFDAATPTWPVAGVRSRGVTPATTGPDPWTLNAVHTRSAPVLGKFHCGMRGAGSSPASAGAASGRRGAQRPALSRGAILTDGGRRGARRQQAKAELARARLAEAETTELIVLDVRVSWEAARVARQGLEAAQDRLAAARRSYELVARRHAHGAASFLELLDARTTFTNAGLNQVPVSYTHLTLPTSDLV